MKKKKISIYSRIENYSFLTSVSISFIADEIVLVADDTFDDDNNDVKLLFDDVILSLLLIVFFNVVELLVDFLILGFITGPIAIILYYNQVVYDVVDDTDYFNDDDNNFYSTSHSLMLLQFIHLRTIIVIYTYKTLIYMRLKSYILTHINF